MKDQRSKVLELDSFYDGLTLERIETTTLIAPTFQENISVDTIPQIMNTLSNNAWNGKAPQFMEFTDGKNVIALEGYVYEPSYEYFSSTASITLNGKILYGYDSRNVDAYQNEEYQVGAYANLDDAISALKECIAEHSLHVTNPGSLDNARCFAAKLSAVISKASHPAPNHGCTVSKEVWER